MSFNSRKLLFGSPNFTDPYWDNVSLLLHGDGIGATPNGQQNNTFLDSSTNNFTITRSGSATQGSFSPFALNGSAYSPTLHGGSGYFNGSTDYLQLPYNGTSQNWQNWWSQTYFTMECWVYVTEFGLDPYGMGDFYLMNWSEQPSLLSNLLAIKADGRLYLYGTGNTTKSATTTSTVQLNTWTHIAFVKNTTSDIAIYVNGVKNSMGTGWMTSAQVLTEARLFVASGTGKCYISGYRTVLGSALYTSNFTPSTTIIAPPTNITGTGLLMNFTNGGIFDNTKKNVLTTVGDAKVSTSVVKYGTGAMYFDGTGDYLTMPDSNNFALGTGNATIEFWIYPTALIQDSTIFAISTTANSNDCYLQMSSGGALNYRENGVNISTANLLNTNTWTHVAIVRNGGTRTVYVNGTSAVTGGTANITSNRCFVGAYSSGTLPIQGYIDDLRITKGIARYTAAFTPPTRAFPNK